ncbi:hypothetical protein FRC12_007745 [Ceratobasidium sp. 428]|nr:hypothetical protein FRC12_007745 [Ceratobasidium sp. 428]
MLNLTVLSVNFQPNDFDSIFQGLSLPFRLNKFSSPFPPSIYFLRNQPSITILELPKYSHTDYDYWEEFHDRTILPSLRHVKAPDGLIWSLVPGRPVTKAVCLGAGPLLNTVTLDTVASSSSGVIWIECVILMSSWEYCVQELVASTLSMTLERLCLRLLEHDTQQASAPRYQLRLLSGLSKLKRLDLKIFESKKPSKHISDWLGRMTLDRWKSLVPSLEVVTSLGRVID